MMATMLVLSLGPVFGVGVIGVLVVLLVLVLINGDRRANVPAAPHDPEAEIQRITRQTRFRAWHPVKARLAKLLRVD
jgi:hypothetical protein